MFASTLFKFFAVVVAASVALATPTPNEKSELAVDPYQSGYGKAPAKKSEISVDPYQSGYGKVPTKKDELSVDPYQSGYGKVPTKKSEISVDPYQSGYGKGLGDLSVDSGYYKAVEVDTV